MAYIRRHPRTPYIVAVFKLPNGRYTNRSTKVTDEGVAMAMAQAWELAGNTQVAQAQFSNVMAMIEKAKEPIPTSTTTLGEYYARWLDHQKETVVHLTWLRYKNVVGRFLRFSPKLVSLPVHAVSTEDVVRWRDGNAHLARRTQRNNLEVLRGFFGAAVREQLILSNPAIGVHE